MTYDLLAALGATKLNIDEISELRTIQLFYMRCDVPNYLIIMICERLLMLYN